MQVVAEWVYSLGTMLTGIPRESFINDWHGILQRLVHIPTQLVSSKNLHILLSKPIGKGKIKKLGCLGDMMRMMDIIIMILVWQ